MCRNIDLPRVKDRDTELTAIWVPWLVNEDDRVFAEVGLHYRSRDVETCRLCLVISEARFKTAAVVVKDSGEELHVELFWGCSKLASDSRDHEREEGMAIILLLECSGIETLEDEEVVRCEGKSR